jgi:hypothetical protein
MALKRKNLSVVLHRSTKDKRKQAAKVDRVAVENTLLKDLHHLDYIYIGAVHQYLYFHNYFDDYKRHSQLGAHITLRKLHAMNFLHHDGFIAFQFNIPLIRAYFLQQGFRVIQPINRAVRDSTLYLENYAPRRFEIPPQFDTSRYAIYFPNVDSSPPNLCDEEPYGSDYIDSETD